MARCVHTWCSANTHTCTHTHTRARARTHAHTHTRAHAHRQKRLAAATCVVAGTLPLLLPLTHWLRAPRSAAPVVSLPAAQSMVQPTNLSGTTSSGFSM
jgi:hypothetical protein